MRLQKPINFIAFLRQNVLSDGTDGPQKCPLFFFGDVLNSIPIEPYTYMKKCPDIFASGLKIWKSWEVAPIIFKITMLRRLF